MPSPSAAVKRYLEALASYPPMNRKAKPVAKLRAQLEATEREIDEETNVVKRLLLHQKVVELRDELDDHAVPAARFREMEDAFIDHAADWVAKSGTSRETLRAAGVPARVLKAAGL